MALKVKDGYQVKHNGKMYHGGDTIEGARSADVQKWLGVGWVEEVKQSDSKFPAKKTTSRGDS